MDNIRCIKNEDNRFLDREDEIKERLKNYFHKLYMKLQIEK